MIKINLLPVRASKKKETVRQQISILVISVVGVLIIGVSLFSLTLSKISSTTMQIENSENELKQLKAKIGEIDNIKKLQAEVKKKLDILNQLRRDKAGPASRLAKLSDSVPDKLWLTKYVETGRNIAISGIALNEELIAEFMRNLTSSGAFTNVELQVSEQTEIAGIKVKKFDLAFAMNVAAAEPIKPTK
jgi:type IV pilus assembly protein PilN